MTARLVPVVLALCAACAPHHPAPLEPPPPPDPPAAGARSKPIAELHAHVFHRDSIGRVFKGYPDSDFIAKDPGERFVTQVTTSALLAANVRLVVSYAYVPSLIGEDRSLTAGDREEALRQIRKAAKFAEDDPRWDLVRTRKDADDALAAGRIALVLGIEGISGIVDTPGDVDLFWKEGVRVMTLAHFSDGEIAGSARSNLRHPENFNFFGKGGGLTSKGETIVARMVDVGMIIDLAHASDPASRDVLRVAGAKARFLISHTAMRSLHPSERNTSDEIAREVAKRGGVVGMILWPMNLTFEGIDDCRAFGAHFRKLRSVVGDGHLAIGGDWNAGIDRPPPCPGKDPIANIGDVPKLLDTLQEEGVPPSVLDGMTDNALRLLPD